MLSAYPRVRAFVRPYLILIMVASLFYFNYLGYLAWWISALETGLLTGIGYLVWGTDLVRHLGIPNKPISVIFTFVVFIGVVLTSYFVCTLIAHKHGLTLDYHFKISHFHYLFYSFNDEVIYGALLMFYLGNVLGPKYMLLISIVVALGFTIIHYLFYQYSASSLMEDTLYIPTLISLFFVGLIRNNLIYIFRHIGYAWAIHAGFISVVFGVCIYRASHLIYGGANVLNLVLGDIFFMGPLGIIAVWTSWWLDRSLGNRH